MAKPKDEIKEQLIYQTALKIILKDGFTGLKMSRLAKESGVATGTLYIYFNTKEQLINKLFIRLKEKHQTYTLLGITPDTPFFQNFKQAWYNVMQYALDYPEEVAFLDQYHRSVYLKVDTKDAATTLLRPIDELLQQGKKELLIKPIDTALLRNHLNGSIRYLASAHHEGHVQMTKRKMGQAFQLAWDSIKR